jgi:hypothetical protein
MNLKSKSFNKNNFQIKKKILISILIKIMIKYMMLITIILRNNRSRITK